MNKVSVLFPELLTDKAAKVLEIMERDGGITHLTALHYNIGSITKEITRVRDAFPIDNQVITQVRKDANGNKYTRWVLEYRNKHFGLDQRMAA